MIDRVIGVVTCVALAVAVILGAGCIILQGFVGAGLTAVPPSPVIVAVMNLVSNRCPPHTCTKQESTTI